MTHEPIREFHEKQNCDYVIYGNSVFFENGAFRENSHYGVMKQPPTDQIELLKMKLMYWKVKHERFVKSFEAKKHEIITSCSIALRQPLPHRPGQTADEIKNDILALQQNVQNTKAKIEEIETKLEEIHGMDPYVKQQRERAALAREEHQQILDVIQTIEI